MADLSQQKGTERLTPSGAPESHEKKRAEPRISEAAEVRREAAEVVSGVESKEGKEGAVEFSEGKVAEQVKEDKKKGPMGTSGTALTDDEIEAIRAKLLANLPPQAVMMKQIKNTLVGQEKQLKKQYRAAKRQGPKAAWQLNNVVAKLRKIREYFSLLANATFEVIKQLWLKIVHGV